MRTMLRLMAERPDVRVAADQIGSPTYAPSPASALWCLATALWCLATTGFNGLHHFSDSDVASWYDFAEATQGKACGMGLLKQRAPVIPIASADYPTPARRPHFPVQDKTETYAALGQPADHWRQNLRLMLRELSSNE